MNEKLKSILNNSDEPAQEKPKEPSEEDEIDLIDGIENDNIITTEEELEGFNIIRSILSEVISVDDITLKDVERYCGILYKNNTRKWICRLYFNSGKKSIIISAQH